MNLVDVLGIQRGLVTPRLMVFVPFGTSFNALFGDPLPNQVKELHVTYVSGPSVSGPWAVRGARTSHL